jgi:hypothetical protein
MICGTTHAATTMGDDDDDDDEHAHAAMARRRMAAERVRDIIMAVVEQRSVCDKRG